MKSILHSRHTLDTVYAISSLGFPSTRRIAENFEHDFPIGQRWQLFPKPPVLTWSAVILTNSPEPVHAGIFFYFSLPCAT